MATHTKVRTSWVANQPVLHGEFAALDFGQFDSISCSGGTYAPASVITVGGAGMTLALVGTNTLASAATFNLANNATIELQAGSLLLTDAGSFVAIHGSTSFNPSSDTIFAAGSTTSLAGDFDMPASGVLQTDAGSTVLLEGSVTLGPTATLAVGCASTFSAAITAQSISTTGLFSSGGISCVGLSVSGGASLAGISLSGPLVPTGNGQIISRIVFGGDANATYSKNSADVVIIEDTVLSAARTYTIDNVSAQSGSTMTIRKDTSGHDVTIKANGGATVALLTTTAGGGYRWVDLIFTTQWELLRFEVAS